MFWLKVCSGDFKLFYDSDMLKLYSIFQLHQWVKFSVVFSTLLKYANLCPGMKDQYFLAQFFITINVLSWNGVFFLGIYIEVTCAFEMMCHIRWSTWCDLNGTHLENKNPLFLSYAESGNNRLFQKSRFYFFPREVGTFITDCIIENSFLDFNSTSNIWHVLLSSPHLLLSLNEEGWIAFLLLYYWVCLYKTENRSKIKYYLIEE